MPSAITLEQFEVELRGRMAGRANIRPFVCDGSPLHCKVFIVGFNPATEMNSDFWSFWDSRRGFNKTAWLDAYTREREARALKPGKRRRASISNTRRVIEWILDSMGPEIRCLETNLYSVATEKESDLPQSEQVTEVLDYLVRTINPRVIISHGEKAKRYIEEYREIRSLDWIFIAKRHFSRGWSRLDARALGERIKFEIGKRGL